MSLRIGVKITDQPVMLAVNICPVRREAWLGRQAAIFREGDLESCSAATIIYDLIV
jgi:hypothetical protein